MLPFATRLSHVIYVTVSAEGVLYWQPDSRCGWSINHDVTQLTSPQKMTNRTLVNQTKITVSSSNNNNNNRFTALCPEYPGKPVPEETLTHPPSWSSPNLYQLLPSTTIHSILLVQITCLAIFLHNLFPCPLWSTSRSGALHLIFHTFLHPISVFLTQYRRVMDGRTDIGKIQYILHTKLITTRMWANAQRDGRHAKYRWHPLFNATKFGWRPLLNCRAVTLPRRENFEIHRGASNSPTDLSC